VLYSVFTACSYLFINAIHCFSIYGHTLVAVATCYIKSPFCSKFKRFYLSFHVLTIPAGKLLVVANLTAVKILCFVKR